MATIYPPPKKIYVRPDGEGKGGIDLVVHTPNGEILVQPLDEKIIAHLSKPMLVWLLDQFRGQQIG